MSIRIHAGLCQRSAEVLSSLVYPRTVLRREVLLGQIHSFVLSILHRCEASTHSRTANRIFLEGLNVL